MIKSEVDTNKEKTINNAQRMEGVKGNYNWPDGEELVYTMTGRY